MIRFLRRGPPAPRLEMGNSNMGRFIPRGMEPQGGRGKAAWPIVLACALLVANAMRLFAQGVDTHHVPARSFNIPFKTDNDPRIVEVILYVSSEGKPYSRVDMVKPAARRFYFSAPSDGWYSFIVQTRDQGGVLTPADLRGAAPSIRVCVDTQSPFIEELEQSPPREGSPVGIHWKINELNLQEIWADYRSTSGGEWLPLFLPKEPQGTYTWKPAWGGELEVRMQALDKAGHRSQVKMLRMRVADNVARMPPPAEPAGAGKVLHVKSKTFQLQYQLDQDTIGPSKVASVDIWKLYQGRGWQKCREKGDPSGPATVTVDVTGRWGFRLIPLSGVGLKERDPQPGDTPDIWVEVDDKPPQVKITNVTVTQEPDGGYLTVYWKADDTHLHAMPITILLSTNPQGGPWVPIAKDLPNTGSWRQKTDDLRLGEHYEFSLKVEALDEAVNVGSDQWRETVKVDLKIPRIKRIEIKPGGAAAGGGQEAYGDPRPAPLDVPMGGTRPASRSPSSINGSGRDFATPKP